MKQQQLLTNVERWFGLGGVFVDVSDTEHGGAGVTDAVHKSCDDEEVQCWMCAGWRLFNSCAAVCRYRRRVIRVLRHRALTELFWTTNRRCVVVCFHTVQNIQDTAMGDARNLTFGKKRGGKDQGTIKGAIKFFCVCAKCRPHSVVVCIKKT